MKRACWILAVLCLLAGPGRFHSSPSWRAFAAPPTASQPTGTSGASGRPATGGSAGAEELQLVLLHVNDVHGQLEGTDAGGGYARLAALVKQVRGHTTANRVLLIHAGDEFSRGDALTRRTLGQANVAIINALGFDLWTPGNGEFYDGRDNLALAIARAQMPVLTANVVDRATGKPLGREYVIERMGDCRIAFFGLCTVRAELPSAWPLAVEDPLKAAGRLVPRLRPQADLVVAVTHIGFDEDVKLAQTVAGIDLIIGGHSHTLLPEGKVERDPNGHEVLIAQAGEYLGHCGRVDLLLRRQDGGPFQIVHSRLSVIPLDASRPKDEAIVRLIERLKIASTQPATASQPAPIPN